MGETTAAPDPAATVETAATSACAAARSGGRGKWSHR